MRLVRDSNPWPLRNWCSALPVELTSQLGASCWIARYKPVKGWWWWCSYVIIYEIIYENSCPCCRASICSLTDHRWRQNAVKTKKLVRSGTRPAGECVTDVFTEQSHGNIESICFIRDWKRKLDRYTKVYLPRTAWLFEDLCQFI